MAAAMDRGGDGGGLLCAAGLCNHGVDLILILHTQLKETKDKEESEKTTGVREQIKGTQIQISQYDLAYTGLRGARVMCVC